MNNLVPKIDLARKRIAALYDTGRITADPPVFPDAGFKKNIDAVAVSRALLEVFKDVEPIVYETLLADEFDLLEKWGIDPRPLFSLNSPQKVEKGIQDIFGVDVTDSQVDFQQALAYLEEINTALFLGKSTPAKMAYLKPITGRAFKFLTASSLQEHFTDVINATIELLNRQAKRLQRQAAACTHIDRLILSLNDLLVRHLIKERFAGHSLFAGNPNLFYRVYADEIAQLAADHFSNPCFAKPDVLGTFRVIRKKGIEVSFARRNRRFITSGDYYGDCTACEVRSQVDPEIANIHWTVYSWLLDPHYRILDVFFYGRRVLKGHVLPLIIQGRKVLMLDAIETIPSIRDYLRGKKNQNISKHIYARRLDILQALFDAVKALADDMGVQAVYVDKYSNTKWVREEVGRLPSDSYHISEVIKPFQNDLIAAVIERILNEPPADVVEEIQARNIGLMDQQLRPNYKEVGVLTGRRKDYFIAIRGI